MNLMSFLLVSIFLYGRAVSRSSASRLLNERFSLMQRRTENRYLPGTVSVSFRLLMNESGVLYSRLLRSR